MHKVDLAAIDLNLLTVLEALLIEQHVTRAAERVHLSQPAVSRALSRLRTMFDDPLLVRVGQQMQPTPRGEALLGPLRQVLGDVSELVAPSEFDPRAATGTIRLAAPSIVTYMLGPGLIRRVAHEAPGLDIEIVQWSANWREHLASGTVDLTFGDPAGDEAGIYSRVVIRNEWATVVRAGHPILQKRWCLASYLELSHLLVSLRPNGGGGQIDDALAALGKRRRIAVRIPYIILSPLMVAETDLALSTARWLAEKLAKGADLVILETPLEMSAIDLEMVWHERTHRDPKQRWLRTLLREIAKESRYGPSAETASSHGP